MALVRITRKLIEDVSTTCHRMLQAECEQDIGPIIATFNGQLHNDFIDRVTWGDHLHLKSLIPNDWLRSTSSVYLRFTLNDNRHINVEFRDLNVSMRPGLNYTSYDPPKINLDSMYHLREQFPVIDEIYKAVDQQTRKRDLEARWKKTREDVLAFLDKCKSLNEALKLFPAIRLYIPAQYLAEVDRKVVREKEERKDLLSAETVEELTAAAMAARLAGMVKA
jgi:hypothetical protein